MTNSPVHFDFDLEQKDNNAIPFLYCLLCPNKLSKKSLPASTPYICERGRGLIAPIGYRGCILKIVQSQRC